MEAIVRNDSYSIEINGVTHSGFVKESEWEGFIKFKSDQGVVVVCQNTDGFPDILNMITGDKDETKYTVVKSSPSFVGSDT